MNVFLQKFATPAWPLRALIGLGGAIARMPVLGAFLLLLVHLVVATALCALLLVLRPRIVEDLALVIGRLQGFGRREDGTPRLGAFLSVLLLPLTVTMGLLLAMARLVVDGAYRLVFLLGLYRCPGCRGAVSWRVEKLRCEHCSHVYAGPLDRPCPNCLFAPNATRCPRCAYLFTMCCVGHDPSPLARTGAPDREDEA